MAKYIGERLAICLFIFVAAYGFLDFSDCPGNPFRCDFNGFQIICMVIAIFGIIILAALED